MLIIGVTHGAPGEKPKILFLELKSTQMLEQIRLSFALPHGIKMNNGIGLQNRYYQNLRIEV